MFVVVSDDLSYRRISGWGLKVKWIVGRGCCATEIVKK